MKTTRITLFLILLLAAVSATAQKDSRIIESEGNIITIDMSGRDTLEIMDPETNETSVAIRKVERFALLNGNPVYQHKEAEQPTGSAAQVSLNGFIEKLLEDEIRSNINSFGYLELILDEKGEIAYFKTLFRDRDGNPKEQSSTTSDMFIKLSDVNFKPARKDGVAVPYYIRIE